MLYFERWYLHINGFKTLQFDCMRLTTSCISFVWRALILHPFLQTRHIIIFKLSYVSEIDYLLTTRLIFTSIVQSEACIRHKDAKKGTAYLNVRNWISVKPSLPMYWSALLKNMHWQGPKQTKAGIGRLEDKIPFASISLKLDLKSATR